MTNPSATLTAADVERIVDNALRNRLPEVVARGVLPTADVGYAGRLVRIPGAAGARDTWYICVKLASDAYSWVSFDTGLLTGIDFLVGTATGLLSGEIVAGTAPGGELGGTWPSPTVDTTHSGSSHAGVITTHEAASDPHTGYVLESAHTSHVWVRRASNTNEATTTSTSVVDLLAFASLSIPVTSGIVIEGVARKSAGAAAYVGLGLKLNATVVCEASSAGIATQVWTSSNTDQAESGCFRLEFMPRSANYLRTGTAVFGSLFGGAGFLTQNGNAQNNSAAPNATITDIAIRAISGDGAVTAAIKEVAIYEVLYS